MPHQSGNGRPILEVRNLSIGFDLRKGHLGVVKGVNFALPRGRTVALLGESGCGKSVTSLAIMGLLDPPGRITDGEIVYRRDEAQPPVTLTSLDLNGAKYRRIRGGEIAMIFQEPRASLTPVYTIGAQISEALLQHMDMSKKQARDRSIELLTEVGIPAPERRVDEYPHQLSGGMCQRAMIAMALCCNPALLIADEPTTALDVTIQAQVLDLLRSMQEAHGMSILIVTHDMHVVAEMADEVVVMYLGKLMESGRVEDIFDRPLHPYTKGLFECVPNPESDPLQPLPRISGTVPDPSKAPRGCPFRGRCPKEMDICSTDVPTYQARESGHRVACWLYEDDARLERVGEDKREGVLS